MPLSPYTGEAGELPEADSEAKNVSWDGEGDGSVEVFKSYQSW